MGAPGPQLTVRVEESVADADVAAIPAHGCPRVLVGACPCLIAAAAALPEDVLRSALSQLVGAELIYQRGVPPDATYQFKHALVQDASYASLVRSRRQQLHGQIARALEEGFPDIVATEPETLAHHLTEAGLTEPAITYWGKAGLRATARPAYVEALNHLERGLALVGTLPESARRDRYELGFLLGLRHPSQAVYGYSYRAFEDRFERARIYDRDPDYAARTYPA